METNAPTQSATQISASITLEHDALSALTQHQLLVLTSLKAPLFVDEKERAPIDLVTVVDTSGSMSGTSLDLVKTTLHFIVKEFNHKDKLSIVSFNSTISTVLKFTPMNADGKQSATEAINRLQATGGTNLSDGLLEGLRLMRNRTSPNEVASLMLLTDGMANEGIRNVDQIVAAMLSQKTPTETDRKLLPCSIYTFGYGSNHDSNMLRKIADAADGIYYFIETQESVAESFADCLGGLLSVVAQNILLKFEATEGSKIESVITKYKVVEVTPGSVYHVQLGDLQSEEQRDILCSVVVPALKEPSPKTAILKVQLEYFNIVSSLPDSLTLEGFVERPAEVDATKVKPVPQAIDLQRNRIKVSEALEKANKLAAADKMAEGNKVLTEALASIGNSTTAKEEYVQDMMNDIQECQVSMTSRASYQRGGAQKMDNMYMAHSKQRSAKASPSISKPSPMSSTSSISGPPPPPSSKPSYQTEAKKKMISKFKSEK